MEAIYSFDFGVLDFIQNAIRNPVLDPIMMCFSHFAKYGIGWIILSLILLIPKKTRFAGALALGSMLLGMCCGEFIIKPLVMRVRPYDMYEAFHGAALPFTLNAGRENTSSFPSGHTCASFACAVSYFRINRRVGIIATVAAALVGFSRMYNYVHFPTDVLAGAALGIISALVVYCIFKKFSLDDKLQRLGQK